MSDTIYTIEEFDFEITDPEVAEEFAEQGHRVTAVCVGGSDE